MRLIDADALLQCKFSNPIGYTAFSNLVKRQPTIEPDQEKPAKWIIYEVANCDGEPPIAWECPECGEIVNCKYKFCPECGKPMEV